jgi:hypothetical protein
VGTPWLWTLDDGPSDLAGGGGLGDRRLLFYPETSGTITVTIPFGGSGTIYFWSAANQPGASDWPVGPYQVELYVTGANAHVNVKLTSITRTDGFGTAIESYASAGADLPCSPTGPKAWSGTTLAPAIQPTAGDRVRLGFTFTHDGSIGSRDVTFGFGDPTRDFIQVPILMANPQIVWNGNTLAFPGPLTGYAWRSRADRSMDVSAGRISATGLRSSYDEVRVQLANFDDVQFYMDSQAWWSWARRGKQYAFALDSADVVDLALSGAAAAGQKDIPLAVTAAVVVGRRYRLREAAGDEEEIVQIASVTTNVKATAQVNLKYGYLTGDVFRSLDYFPKVVSADSDKPFSQGFTTYALDHVMTEDRG